MSNECWVKDKYTNDWCEVIIDVNDNGETSLTCQIMVDYRCELKIMNDGKPPWHATEVGWVCYGGTLAPSHWYEGTYFKFWYILNIFDISLPELGSKKFQKVQSLRGKSCYHAMHYRCVQMRFWKLKTFLKVENSFHDTESMTWLRNCEILFKINNQSSGWHLNECVTFI